MTAPTLLWLRRDLRLGDHPALTAAVERGGPVIPVFIHDDSVADLGAAPKWRMGEALRVFGAALSYVLMMISHIVLRRREPDMPRPYRTPGGVVTTGFALVIGVFAVIATFLVDYVAAFWCLGVFALFMLYFAVYSRHKLVGNSPDEEFAMLAKAESELK